MPVTVADLRVFVGATTGDDPLLTDCLAEGQALVDEYNVAWDAATETYVASAAPTAIVDRAYLEVAADLWNRRNAPNGVMRSSSRRRTAWARRRCASHGTRWHRRTRCFRGG